MESLLKDVIDFFFKPLDVLVYLILLLLLAIIVQILILLFYKRISAKITKSYVDDKAGKKKKKYRPMVLYSYIYRGNKYSGLSGGILKISTNDGLWAKRIVSQNPVGKTITVLVNPFFPSHSEFAADIKPFHWMIILILIFLTVFAIVLMNAGYELTLFKF
jgi:hypothetical protein